MGFLIRFHVIPPSGLHDRPPPTVPTQSVKSCAMAVPPLQAKLTLYLFHSTIIGQIRVHSQRIAFLLRHLFASSYWHACGVLHLSIGRRGMLVSALPGWERENVEICALASCLLASSIAEEC